MVYHTMIMLPALNSNMWRYIEMADEKEDSSKELEIPEDIKKELEALIPKYLGPPGTKYKSVMDIPVIRDMPDKLEANGVKVPKAFIIDLPNLTVKKILEQPNAEVRRLGIEVYPGQLQGFLRDGGGKVVMKPKGKDDYQFARIVRMELDTRKLYYIVLTNRTPEPGSEKLTPQQRKDGLM